jgi:RimJ/RimL family protein N-acetyltransferase
VFDVTVPSLSGPITLRRFTPTDVDFLVDLDSDPEVIRYLFREPTPRHVVEEEILPRILEGYDRFPGSGQWAAEWKASHEFVGWFSLQIAAADHSRRPELGYRLRRKFWRRGIASSVVPQLLTWAFTHLEAEAVTAETMAVNVASRRVMEKSGLRHVETIHRVFDDPLPGTEQGEVEYEITRRQWAK